MKIMDGLDGWRSKIDEIDYEIIKLFQERMALVANIAKYKEENNLPIFQEDREKKVIEKNLKYVTNDDMKEYAEEFIHDLMNVSKKYQCKKVFSERNTNLDVKECRDKKDVDSFKIGYGGVEGAFSEEALIKYFGDKVKKVNYEQFEWVFEALKEDKIDYGVLPIENSSAGVVNDVYDLLRKYGFYIIGEEYISISQHLLGLKGTDISDIKEVYSHPQGLQQSSNFLKTYEDWRKIPYHNTALAAKLVSEGNDTTKVAIASERAANIYNLEILQRNINNEESNKTRFIVIGKELENSEDKISIIFKLENKVGTLFNVLKFVNDYGLNMLKIESRPVGNEPWEYYFYLDFQGNLQDDKVKDVLTLIEKNSSYFRLLGAYKSKY